MKRADFLRLMARLPEGRVMDLCAKIVMKCALVDGAGLAEADRYVVGNNVVCLPWVIPATIRRRKS